MIKFVEEDTLIGYREIPDEISLCVNISNCQNNCKGCHSPYLRKDTGFLLDFKAIDDLIMEYEGVTCFCFMGEGKSLLDILHAAGYIKNSWGLKVALYSGRENIPEDAPWHIFNYIKIGPFKEEYGPLDEKTTNQRLYMYEPNNEEVLDIDGYKRKGWKDITYKFWKR